MKALYTATLVFLYDNRGAYSTMDGGRVHILPGSIQFCPEQGTEYECDIFPGPKEDSPFLAIPTAAQRESLPEAEWHRGTCKGEVTFRPGKEGSVRAFHPVTNKVTLLKGGCAVPINLSVRVMFEEVEGARVVYCTPLEKPEQCAARHGKDMASVKVYSEPRRTANSPQRPQRDRPDVKKAEQPLNGVDKFRAKYGDRRGATAATILEETKVAACEAVEAVLAAAESSTRGPTSKKPSPARQSWQEQLDQWAEKRNK